MSTPQIQNTVALFHALRTIIPNIPLHHVESLVLTLGPVGDVPKLSVVMACVGPGGEYVLTEDKSDVKRETRRFKIVPEEDTAA